MQLTSLRAALQARLIAATQALVGDDPAARFGVAVSGGPDSMALLYLAAQSFAGRVAAVTIDHGLRPASADEAAMVARWCAGQGVAHHVATPDMPPTGNIQSWARTQRYALIEQWRLTQGIDWVMTAHHADDQLETLLMRLNRGSGVGGLAGVRGRSGTVIRPLLGVRKAALQQLVDDEELPHVHDPSNADPRFDRAALRAALAGADWLNPEAAARSAAALAEAEAALDWSVAELAARHVECDGRQWRLDRTDLPREYMRRLILHMLRAAAPDAALPRGDALDRAIGAAQAGGRANLGNWLLRGGSVWTLRRAPPRVNSRKVPQPDA
ncbi:tRNA(Ile)-lysidine synthetase [Sphingobium indicum BiD32]|uniref:tRNA(Ile)-lysidine synthase n=1 Tax=Sphingobium indicum BiD32 TaxID=1301087 RepID=N1MKA0_9SPHN|nr:tRNA lysidine(34) synthetase TilS [Sphingobium indicum]CCW17645.1 tRNA(Ile)-lysidine synthetase [Sphingobium indicum BiD32]